MRPTPKFRTFVDDEVAPPAWAQDEAASPLIRSTMPRYINEIIIHCTATPHGRDYSAKQIDQMHRANGWRCIGYHYLIRLDGMIERGRAISQPGAHCYGHNAHSIGIAYVGGLDDSGQASDTRTPAQKDSLLQLTAKLIKMYGCDVHGHNEYAAKACPCFDVRSEFGRLREQLCRLNG